MSDGNFQQLQIVLNGVGDGADDEYDDDDVGDVDIVAGFGSNNTKN